MAYISAAPQCHEATQALLNKAGVIANETTGAQRIREFGQPKRAELSDLDSRAAS